MALLMQRLGHAITPATHPALSEYLGWPLSTTWQPMGCQISRSATFRSGSS